MVSTYPLLNSLIPPHGDSRTLRWNRNESKIQQNEEQNLAVNLLKRNGVLLYRN